MPFEGPEGQTFEDFEHCVETLSEDENTSEEEAKEICGRWQSESKNESNSIPIVDLTDVSEELQQFEEGSFVKHEEHGAGIVGAILEGGGSWPVGEDDTEEIDEDTTVYIIALVEGGSVPAEAGELESIDALPGEGEEPEDPEEVEEKVDEVELSPIYERMDDPMDFEQLEEARKEIIFERNAEALAEHVESEDVTFAELKEMSSAELLDMGRVEDPEVGFRTLPNGWNRKSVLRAWVTLGMKWRSCRARMIRHFGNRMAKRWCAALKDEVYGTERWRNRW